MKYIIIKKRLNHRRGDIVNIDNKDKTGYYFTTLNRYNFGYLTFDYFKPCGKLATILYSD